MPNVIIFDLDDTIIAWDAVAAEVWLRVCREAGKDEPLDMDQIAGNIRQTGSWYWSDPERHRQGRLNLFETRRLIARLAFERLGIDRPDLAERIADTYSRTREDATFLIPDAVSTLEELRNRGIRLAMITNGASEIQRAKIDRFQLEPLFEHIIIEGELGTGKPEPGVFLHVLDVMDVNAGDVWMVGDDLVRDIAPCRSLGIFSVWVDSRERGLPADTAVTPDRVIRTITDLPGLLDAG
ncbi:MAG: HAD family hydrolase [Dehalococcoidales bacterium]|nr:HAD family hydrolase [Dehalococcoidales bacterium]